MSYEILTVLTIITLVVFGICMYLRNKDNISDFLSLTIGGSGCVLCVFILIFLGAGFGRLHNNKINIHAMKTCPLNGSHELRRLNNGSTISGYFIFGTGSINTDLTTYFSWDTGLGYYKTSTISVTKIRWVIGNVEKPYIEFSIDNNCQDQLDSFDGITVHLKEEDFPKNINLSGI
jgi:hypothetical protein